MYIRSMGLKRVHCKSSEIYEYSNLTRKKILSLTNIKYLLTINTPIRALTYKINFQLLV